MKSKIRSSVSAALATAVVFVSISPALAAADTTYVTLNSWSGTPGTSITASGGGWKTGDTIDIYFGSASGTPAGSALVATNGSFTSPLTVPDSASQGSLAIIALDTTTHLQESNFYYVDPLAPMITITAPSHAPFATVQVSGTGFAPNETVDLGLAGASSTAAANAQGSFMGTIVVPVTPSGLYHLSAIGASSGASVPSYSNYFWIDGFYPSAAPSSYYVVPGANLAFNGSGFAPSETINVTADTNSSILSTISANTSGSFTSAGSFAVPIAFAGTSHTFTLAGIKSGSSVSAKVTIGNFYPSISPASYYVVPNSSLTITGSGFAPNESVTLSDGMATTTAAADVNGHFTGAITVPFSSSGSATIMATGSLSGAHTSVGVTLARFYGSVTPSSYFAYPGAMISYHGTGFAPNETVNIQSGTSMSSIVANSLGNFTTASTTLPFTASASIHTTFTGLLSGTIAAVDVAIGTLSPYLSADSYSAQQGGVVHVTGYSFAPGETVAVHAGSFNTTTVANTSGTTPAVAVTLPYGVTSAQVTLTGASSGASASASIALAAFNPQVVPNTYYSTPGTSISFTGSGFAPNETVAVTFNGNAIASATASSTGAFSYSYTPSLTATNASFVFTGETSGASNKIAIGIAPYAAYLQLSTYYAQGGSPITISGTGFAPNETVTLKDNGVTFGSTSANTSGSFSYSGVIPFGAAGPTTLNAIGTSSGASAAATITLAKVYTNLQLGSYAGAPGSAVDFIGSGYLPNEMLSLTSDRTGATPVYTFQADAAGNFNNSGYSIPVSWTGGPLVLTVSGNHSFSTTSITYYVTGK